MKDFNRTNLSFSLCGLNCGLCPMGLDGHCPGCGGGVGNQSCAIARCSLQHDNVEYCFQCPEYPCQRYEGIEEYDSFITHQRQLRDMIKAQETGIETYNEEQHQKARILKTLLSDYNSGRRKTFYCVAVNLLPLKDIENVMEQVVKDASFHDRTAKEKEENIASLFQEMAARQGLILKLRKKPAKKSE
ncbi:MAG: DUF3795 domain-containing protein [Lacrimispora sp.]|uniref:DUF3795 domain-containing protein n=1 Tax=Lacrimispora sp. TaxID=2719234 RepID=UPI0039E27B99